MRRERDRPRHYGCGPEWRAYVGCIAALPPPAENSDCSTPGQAPFPAGCADEIGAVCACLGYQPPAREARDRGDSGTFF